MSNARPPAGSSRMQQVMAEAKLAMKHHSFPRARQLLTEAIELHPSHKLYRLRAVASACLEDYEAALDDAEMVIELQPSSPDGFYHKGFALFQLHDYAAAARAFHEGLSLNPADKIMQRGFWDAVQLMGQSAWQELQAAGGVQGVPPSGSSRREGVAHRVGAAAGAQHPR